MRKGVWEAYGILVWLVWGRVRRWGEAKSWLKLLPPEFMKEAFHRLPGALGAGSDGSWVLSPLCDSWKVTKIRFAPSCCDLGSLLLYLLIPVLDQSRGSSQLCCQLSTPELPLMITSQINNNFLSLFWVLAHPHSHSPCREFGVESL